MNLMLCDQRKALLYTSVHLGLFLLAFPFILSQIEIVCSVISLVLG